MVVELVYVEGFEPSAKSVTNFVSLNARTYKPGGITVVKESSRQESPLYQSDIVSIEDANRTKYKSIQTGLGVLCRWRISHNENGVILGTAYRNTSCYL
jgi:hypothetical protein